MATTTKPTGHYSGTRRGTGGILESCGARHSNAVIESAANARRAAALFGAHYVTWTPDSLESDYQVRRNSRGRLLRSR